MSLIPGWIKECLDEINNSLVNITRALQQQNNLIKEVIEKYEKDKINNTLNYMP